MIRWFWLLLGLVAFWLFRRLLRPSTGREGPTATRAPGRREGRPSEGGRMVRDRVCNTFVPRSSALVHRDAEGEHFFCSESCRDRFLAAASDSARPEGPTARN